MAGSAREEAERLVATILARAAAGGLGAAAGGRDAGGDNPSGTRDADVLGMLAGMVGSAARGHSGGSWSTGSAECCVCPVCKAIAAMRDPSPETAERLATGAGDLASGVAGLMRAFSSMAGSATAGKMAGRTAGKTAGERPRPEPRPANPDGVWARATDEAPVAEPVPGDPWAAASAESAREAAAAAKARAAAAEQAVARAVEQARAAAEARRAAAPDVGRTGTGSDVWAAATSEAAANDAARPRSVDHDLGAPAPEDRDAGPGDGARAGDAV